MFSLFQEKPPEDTPSDSIAARLGNTVLRQLQTLGGHLAEKLRASVPYVRRLNRSTVILAIALFATLVFGIHEQRVAARLQARHGETGTRALPPGQAGPLPAQPRSLEEERLAAQINALNAKLDAVAHARSAQAPDKPSPTHVRASRSPASDVTIIHRIPQPPKPDPQWQKVRDQLDAQGRQIDAQGKQIESTRQAIASARSDLEGSIARTHEELVALQRKGERNYYEFSLDKSKNFRTVGPLGVSLRKANTKDQYADLKLMVDDREVSKKHLNLYEPVMLYASGERHPVELVINSITKNHVRGYISAAKYRAGDLQSGSTTTSQPTNAAEAAAPRHKLVASPQ